MLKFLKCLLLLTDFGQSRPTGSEFRSTDLAWKNKFSFFSVAGRPVRSTASLSELSGNLGRPVRSTAEAVRALGIFRSTGPVDRESRICQLPIFLSPFLSLSSHFSADPSSSLSLQKPFSTKISLIHIKS